jgi:hypothetical protein
MLLFERGRGGQGSYFGIDNTVRHGDCFLFLDYGEADASAMTSVTGAATAQMEDATADEINCP